MFTLRGGAGRSGVRRHAWLLDPGYLMGVNVQLYRLRVAAAAAVLCVSSALIESGCSGKRVPV